MNNPFWFELIKQWKEKGMGEYGVTFPFLIGALVKQSGKPINRQFIESIFNEIIHKPIKGFYCEVRWCDNIDEPVASIEAIKNIKNKSIKSQFQNSNNELSLAFTSNLVSFLTLKCTNKKECLENLISGTHDKTRKNQFSKNNGTFGEFSSSDISFIENVYSTINNG